MTEQTSSTGADEDPGQPLARLLTLSDGVFAIAITLLVLNLRVSATEPLSVSLRQLGRPLLGAALSFAVIGRVWLTHRWLFSWIRRQDEILLRLNLFFLAGVVAMPFATELLTHRGRMPIQTAAYGATVGATVLLSTIMWSYACAGARLVDLQLVSSPEGTSVVATGLVGLFTALPFFISIALAWINHTAAQLVWIGAALPSRSLIPRMEPLARWLLAGGWRRSGAA